MWDMAPAGTPCFCSSVATGSSQSTTHPVRSRSAVVVVSLTPTVELSGPDAAPIDTAHGSDVTSGYLAK